MKTTLHFPLLLLLICVLNSKLTLAQQVRPMSSSELYLRMQQLANMGTVMYFAAHPDDENTRLISYLVHRDHTRTIYYALTRGDGGQNIIGTEQGSALGLIRTYELLEARKLDGAGQMFSPFIDFGYTTSVPETFSFWNKKKLIADAVDAIQKTRPDIIICRFPTTGEGGHGHHTTSAIIAKAAWEYIQHYNDTTQGHPLWLPKRVLFNAFQFGSRSTIKQGQFKLAINQFDPLLGKGLGELAGESRSQHKSQGAGTPQTVGVSMEHFELMAGAPLKNSLYDGVDTSWNRIGALAIEKKIRKAIASFNFTQPSSSLPALLAIRKDIINLKDTFWQQQKLKEVNQIILSSAGIMAELLTETPEATPGSKLPVKLRLISRSNTKVSISRIYAKHQLEGLSLTSQNLKADSVYQYPFDLKLDQDEPITLPYWMVEREVNHEYQFPDKYLGMPIAPNDLNVTVDFDLDGELISLKVPLSYKKLDPTRGDVTQRFRVVPPISIEPTSNLYFYDPTKSEGKAVLHLKAYQDLDHAQLIIRGGGQGTTTQDLPFLAKGTDTYMVVSIPAESLELTKGAPSLSFFVHYESTLYHAGIKLINYPHIPEIQYSTWAWMKVVPKNWKVAVKKIGYVEGVGDYVDDVLRLAGLNVEMIPSLSLNDRSYLKQYEAIVVGVRAFNTQKALRSGIDALLDYVKDGGTLIIQYNTSTHLLTDRLGPYPLQLGRDRVTDENAAVSFTHQASSLLLYPNKINQDDFKDWVQERGLYFANKWDQEHYQTLFSMHDKGGDPLTGSTLYTPYGKGQYIYTSLAFFRQLPAGNAGAIRLFMNFLSAGHTSAPDTENMN